MLITGAGNAFCAGGDVKAMGNNSNKTEMSFEERVADLRTKQRTLTGALVAVRKPTVAALPGPAAGAGLALALACDIALPPNPAIMSTGYARIGLTGDYGVAWLLTRLVGTSRARELMFLSERIDARRCETLGLVNRVVPDAELRDTAFALAKSLAEGPSIALARIKDNLDHAMTSDFLGVNGSGGREHGTLGPYHRSQGGGARLRRKTKTCIRRTLGRVGPAGHLE